MSAKERKHKSAKERAKEHKRAQKSAKGHFSAKIANDQICLKQPGSGTPNLSPFDLKIRRL